MNATSQVRSVSPFLLVRDVKRATAYYSDALDAEYVGSGADIGCAPDNQPYMMREFQVRDPDGHVLVLAYDLESRGAR